MPASLRLIRQAGGLGVGSGGGDRADRAEGQSCERAGEKGHRPASLGSPSYCVSDGSIGQAAKVP